MDHIIEAAAPAKYRHIDFKPPDGVRKAAKRGLEMRKEHGRGGTAVGVARARDLMNGKTISPSTARRMKAYFDRHQPDQKAEGFDSGEDGYPSAGRVAWLLWGSDAGYAWAKKLVRQMNAADENGKVRSSLDALSDEEVLASFKLRTPTGIPGLRDDDDQAGGYGDFTAALLGALPREKVMDLVEMVGVRMLRALAGPALNGSLKRLLPSLTDSFNIGRKVPITEQEVLSLALRQAKDAAKMDLSARHKALLSEVKSVLESELRGKELPPGDYSMKVPEATGTGDEMYEHLSRRSVKASPCGCDSGCACSTPQNSSGQPPSDMTISNLKQIVRDASELLGLLHENMELMGWAEDKITQAKVAVDSVKNYVLTDFGHEASEAVFLTVAAAKKPWEEKREPEGKLSKCWREEAEKRADKDGRKYPNQVGNMWAKQQQNEARASVAAALLSAADVLSKGGER